MVAGMVAAADPAPVGPPTSVGTGGAAATVERLATQAAIDTLRKGGNAVDAAVTAAAVLGVTEPFSCGIGGGGFMLIQENGKRKPTAIDSREAAPAAMKPDSFWENGAPLAFNSARYSGLSVGVPGTVLGWESALRKHGTISMAEALAPAIAIARNGFVVDQTFADQIQGNLDFFNDIPATAALYLDADGTPRDVGSVFKNPDLARTYELLAARGHKAFYRNELAQAIVDTVTHPQVFANANHVWRPGVMTVADLRNYTAPNRPLAHVNYRGLDVFGMGPPSSGGSTVGEALNILEGYQLSGMTREAALHRFIDASRYSFADRGAYLGDPDYFDVPLRGLLSEDFAATRRALIDRDRGGAPGRAGRSVPVQRQAGQGRVRGHLDDRRLDDAPDGLRPERQRRLVHVHDRVDRRCRAGRARLRLPAQQRADRLRLRLADAPEPRRGRQAPAQLDGADDRAEERQAVPRARLAGRVDDHHDRPAAARRPDRSRLDAAAGDRGPACEPAEHADDHGRDGVPAAREGRTGGPRAHVHDHGARSAPRPRSSSCPAGGVLAAAEPVRRGGGSAMVENP